MTSNVPLKPYHICFPSAHVIHNPSSMFTVQLFIHISFVEICLKCLNRQTSHTHNLFGNCMASVVSRNVMKTTLSTFKMDLTVQLIQFVQHTKSHVLAGSHLQDVMIVISHLHFIYCTYFFSFYIILSRIFLFYVCNIYNRITQLIHLRKIIMLQTLTLSILITCVFSI